VRPTLQVANGSQIQGLVKASRPTLTGLGTADKQAIWEESSRIDAPDASDRGCKGHRINEVALPSGLDADAETRTSVS